MAFSTSRVLLTVAAREARRRRIETAIDSLPALESYPQEPLAVIEGALLSDAGITCKTNGSHGLFKINLSGKEHLDWLAYINHHLRLLGLSQALNEPTTKWVENKKGDYLDCRLWTRRNVFFTMLHRRWYSGNRKVVPCNFTLTPASLANWFMGDGCSTWCFDGLVVAYFSTQSFSKSSTDHLKSELARLGIKQVNDSRPSRGEAPGVQLAVTSASNVTRLMHIIEPLVLPSYKYKIKYPRGLKRLERKGRQE